MVMKTSLLLRYILIIKQKGLIAHLVSHEYPFHDSDPQQKSIPKLYPNVTLSLQIWFSVTVLLKNKRFSLLVAHLNDMAVELDKEGSIGNLVPLT